MDIIYYMNQMNEKPKEIKYLPGMMLIAKGNRRKEAFFHPNTNNNIKVKTEKEVIIILEEVESDSWRVPNFRVLHLNTKEECYYSEKTLRDCFVVIDEDKVV